MKNAHLYQLMAILLISGVYASSPVVEAGINHFLRNFFIYYTWNSTFILCTLWGAFWIVVSAD